MSSASALFIAAIATASAADLSRPIYKAPPPPPPPVFSWTGWYVGFNVGGKWTSNNDAHIEAVGIESIGFDTGSISSAMGGGQVGYNWQPVGSLWVFGIEGDIDGQHLQDTRTLGVPTLFFLPGDSFSFESNWQASIRGRIGYAFWDRTLLYVTGGGAFTQVKLGVNLVPSAGLPFGFSATDDRTIAGGTVGGGFEWAWTNNISLGLEGRWSFYGDQDFTTGVTLVGGALQPITQHIKLDTGEVMGKINFRF